eukprot:Protomagalhaensia_wolfi_Nauph_80__3790@NODE_383_length_2636_cov_7_043897_g289_i0_p2_GENE_NODE_383_length_2636_cov_7_043897_g289_i0NODE_383_length_2636_cov_7_043897_g289_i0_p2_ORF_typecomplete_len332_score64_54Sporozoite_P67/PF05642_11/1_5e03Sporozoite_P67/PF05642_11/0_098YccVlike/PF08755_11/0_11Sigma70_ner/PF04546_13/0_1GCIP/PF13324_6/9_8_NODE_383_length_2636_cov_7_043897_g289_i0491044
MFVQPVVLALAFISCLAQGDIINVREPPALLLRLVDSGRTPKMCLTEVQVYVETKELAKLVTHSDQLHILRYMMVLQYLKYQIDYLDDTNGLKPVYIFDDTEKAVGAVVDYSVAGTSGVIMDGTVTVWEEAFWELVPEVTQLPEMTETAFHSILPDNREVYIIQTTQDECALCSSDHAHTDVIFSCLKNEAQCLARAPLACENTSSQVLNASSGVAVGAGVATAVGLGAGAESSGGTGGNTGGDSPPKFERFASGQPLDQLDGGVSDADLDGDGGDADGDENDDNDDEEDEEEEEEEGGELADDMQDKGRDMKEAVEMMMNVKDGHHLLSW